MTGLMNARRLLVAAVLAGAFGGPSGAAAVEKNVVEKTPHTANLPVEGNLPSLSGATEWLNTQPLTAAGLRGKVVVVEFWTYSCINWLRTLPYVRAWAERYKNEGLVVIGVHSPEFPFEHDVANVRVAAKEMQIGYPIAIDNDFAVWRAFGNEYWPALYFVDARGRIRHHQFGEGDYARSEAVIVQLLSAAGFRGTGYQPSEIAAAGIEAGADWDDLQSPETYLGYQKTQNFASSGGAVPDKRQRYESPARLGLNGWALGGVWTMKAGAAVLDEAGGRVAYRFHARDVNLVMGPPAPGRSVRFRVFVDGRPPGGAHGVDVDGEGYGTITEPRLYQLIRHPKPIVDRRVEVEFLDSGIAAYVFTFG